MVCLFRVSFLGFISKESHPLVLLMLFPFEWFNVRERYHRLVWLPHYITTDSIDVYMYVNRLIFVRQERLIMWNFYSTLQLVLSNHHTYSYISIQHQHRMYAYPSDMGCKSRYRNNRTIIITNIKDIASTPQMYRWEYLSYLSFNFLNSCRRTIYTFKWSAASHCKKVQLRSRTKKQNICKFVKFFLDDDFCIS